MSRAEYSGSCQCGAVAFEVAADLDQVIACNCSRCRRLGWVLTFVPATDFRLVKDGPTAEYLFNKHAISHRFCPACGIQTHAMGAQDGVAMVAVNVNCLDGVDARSLTPQQVDGASL
ncbi:GFA family protein [Paracoccus siganidrum]|uniref:GFA family protein n=1 Tax=Paracoccus siganidrum TaxID=1276757 RepID=A0A419A6J1_9RHOB|nr:GFA family protein [Paracoccus siganidrum]RJL14512.1 GFA family protein [Paracoccus siganidrum]RMC34077.1 GFA family protein [Paracoccus siganidrum]